MMKCLRAASMLICVAAFIVGCDRSGDPQRTIAKAQEYREKSEYKAAAIELKTLLQKTPNHAEARYLLGLTYYDSRDYRMAEQELRRALDLSYERSKVMPALGKSMLMLGEYQRVLDQIPVEAYASNFVQADVLTLNARALMGLNRSGQAKELFNAALVKQPEFAVALLGLARIEAGERGLDDSARLVARAIASSPKYTDAWLMKGELARLSSDQAGVLAANQKVLEIDSTNVAARLNIASLHLANNKLDDARKLITQARSLAPSNVLVFHMQALVDYRARDFKAANDAIQQVLKGAPDFAPSLLLAGAILTELGSFEQAQGYLGAALERAPDNIFARKLLASTLARSGQLQRALDVLEHGLKQAPDDYGLMASIGDLYLQNGEFSKAIEVYDRAAKRDPKNAVARARLGVSRMALGDSDRAITDLESAIAIDSTKHQADILLVVSHLRRGSYDQALKAIESLETKQPNSPVTYNLKAMIFLGKKEFSNARKNFEHALNLKPNFLVAATNLAQLDLLEKKPKAARGRLEAILDTDKGNVQVLLTLAEHGLVLGATAKERLEWLERARNAKLQSVEQQLMLARLYFQMGNSKKAFEVVQQAEVGNSENSQLLELLGEMQTNVGQYEQAVSTYRRLVKLQPKSPMILYRLANAQAGSGAHATAMDTLKQALSLRPDFVDAQITLGTMEIRANRYREALDIARLAQKRFSRSPAGFILEGDVLMAERKFSEAIKAYATAHGMAKTSPSLIKLHVAYTWAGQVEIGDLRLAQWLNEAPDDAVVRLYAAESALKRGGYKDAIAQYEWLRKKQPDNALILNNLAWAYYQVNDVRALGTAEQAYKFAPESALFASTFGWLLVERGDAARGIELLEKTVKVAPNIPEIGYYLAQGWIKIGDKSKARLELKRVLAMNLRFAKEVEARNLLKQLSN